MKRVDSPRPAPAGAGLADAEFAYEHPRLTEFLHDLKWDDGSARESGTISVRIEDGRWNIALNDRDGRSSAYVTAGTLAEGYRMLERGIVAGTLDWRPWNKGKRK